MIIRNTIKTSLRNLRAQKMRSFLTMLGIIIGIFSIILIMSVIAGAESLITNQIKGIGSDVIGILPGKSDDEGPPAAVMGIVITTLKDSDTEAIKKKIPHVAAASSYVTATETVNWEAKKVVATIMGASPSYPNISDSKIVAGRFFTDEDKAANSNVAVIGSQVKEDLFEDSDPIGQKIKIKQNNFTIIGLMESAGTVGFQNVDNAVFIPVTTAQKKILGINHIGFMRVKVSEEKYLKETTERVTELLRERHRIKNPNNDDFTIHSTAQAFEMLGQVTSSLQLFLVAIVSISLVVGGIGIMNIMLAAVTQRIREIGLRKSVGAKKSHIIIQFLTETIILTLAGAIIGIIVGSLFAVLTAKIVNHLGYDWTLVISAKSILISCAASVIVGLVFGLYPAKKAAKLDPITALRYE